MSANFGLEALGRAPPVSETTLVFLKDFSRRFIEEIGIESEDGSKRFDEVRRWIGSLAALVHRHKSVRGSDPVAQLLLRQAVKLARELQTLTDEGRLT